MKLCDRATLNVGSRMARLVRVSTRRQGVTAVNCKPVARLHEDGGECQVRVMVRLHGPTPLQAPVQPLKLQPDAAGGVQRHRRIRVVDMAAGAGAVDEAVGAGDAAIARNRYREGDR